MTNTESLLKSLEPIKMEDKKYYDELINSYSKYLNFDSLPLDEYVEKVFSSEKRAYFTICSKETFNNLSTDKNWINSIIYTPLNDHSRPFMKKGDIVFCYRQGQFSELKEALQMRGIYALGFVASEPKILFPDKADHNKYGVAILFPFGMKNHLELRNIQLNPITISLTPYNGNRNDALQYIPQKEYYTSLLEQICRKNPYLRQSLKTVLNSNIEDKPLADEIWNKENAYLSQELSTYTNPMQTIFYGVPGSGKSHKIKEILQNKLNISNIENQVVRTVFHPEYTNADFVGQILPNVKDGQVQYKFTPGPFSIILKKALLDSKNNYALIIEEINRGNAAAIFGELFQLLDRLEKNQKDEIGGNTYTAGWSEYFVMNSSVNEFVRDAVGEDEKATKALDLFDNSIHFSPNTGIRFPPNLSIFATMNTSDQNVFKLDNAFKRRWDLVLIQNEFGKTDDEIHQRDAQVEGFDFTWEQFRKAANKIITEENDTDSFSDKQLGCWFAKAERISDEEEQFIIPRKLFADKVLEYLWDDVFSFDEGIFFNIANYKTFADVAKSVEDKSKTIKIEDLFSKSFCDEIAGIKNQPGENQADSETSSE